MSIVQTDLHHFIVNRLRQSLVGGALQIYLD